MGLCGSDEFANEDLVDLQAKKSRDEDPMNNWEFQTPFARCNFYTYAHLLKQAHEASGGVGHVSFIAMAETFNTPVWKPIRDPHSALSVLLFKHVRNWKAEQSYDYNGMLMLGLLLSRDSYVPKAKSAEFWDLLQIHSQEKDSISISDPLWVPICNKMFKVAGHMIVDGY